MVMTAKTIPPNEGIAMGTIISEPRPEEVSTGIRAKMVVAVVIKVEVKTLILILSQYIQYFPILSTQPFVTYVSPEKFR